MVAITRILALLSALLLAPALYADAPRGAFGMSMNIDADGFLNPTLRSITITKVEPGMPAAASGMAAGDVIVEVEGKTVAGAKAHDLEPYLKRAVGDSLRLRLKHASGETFDVTLVAVPRK